MHRKPEPWELFIQSVLRELSRVVRPGGFVAFEVGEIRLRTVELETLVLRAATETSLTPVCVMINEQKFTKTSNCWGISNNERGTNSNRVVLFINHSCSGQ